MTLTVERTDYQPSLDDDVPAQLVRLSPDGQRWAFVSGRSAPQTVSVGAAEPQLVGDQPYRVPRDDEPTVDAGPTLLALCRGGPPADLRWSPDGQHVAYRIAGFPPGFGDRIGWARTDKPGEIGSLPGTAFAWAPKGQVLFVANTDAYHLGRVEMDSGRFQQLAELIHARDARFWPQIAPSPSGEQIVFTARHQPEDTVRVWSVARQDGEPTAELVTLVPGADIHVLPFWSPKGRSLGLQVVHPEQQRTGLIVLRNMQGEGEILYRNESLDGPLPPAWAPDGKAIALYCQRATDDLAAPPKPMAPEPLDPAERPTGGPAPPMPDQTLCLLDLETGEPQPLAERGELSGELRFLDERRLVVDGGPTAHVLTIDR